MEGGREGEREEGRGVKAVVLERKKRKKDKKAMDEATRQAGLSGW